MSQISNKLANIIKSNFHRDGYSCRRRRHYEPGESASSRPSRGVGDSVRISEGQRITNIATGTFSGLNCFAGEQAEYDFSRAGVARARRYGARAPHTSVVTCGLPRKTYSCLLSNSRFRHPLMYLASLALMILAFITLISVNNTSAITVSIDNPNLTLNLPTKSTTGDFVESSPATITVNSDSGYTLSITNSSDNTDLTSGSNKITSISSNLSKSDFSNTNNTDYNNKWGYKPSQYVTVDGEDNKTVVDNTGDNSVFKPLPTSIGEILDYKDSSSGDNTYTLSIGARASINTPFGEYQSDTFVIAAVGNVSTDNLIINYDANGGYFGSDTSKTVNSVAHDATAVEGTVTKYSQTSNISDAGVQDGNYSNNANTNEVITIPGASTLHIKLTYAGESAAYDWVSFWAGNYPDYTAASNYSTGVQNCGGGSVTNGKYGGGSGTTVECDISGDTVTFAFRSDGSGVGNGYGYYAVITGEATVYSKTVASGAYTTPALNTADYYGFLGWSTDKNVTTPTYTAEAEISSNLQAKNGDDPITLYAVWNIIAKCTNNTISGITYMQDITSSNKSTILAAMDVDKQYSLKDKRDEKPYCVAKLQDGNIWMTQNLDLDLDSTKELTHADTDLGWGTDTATTTWTPVRSTIDATSGTISGWSDDNNTPYSVNPGDWYWIGNPFYASATCNYLTDCTDKFTKTPSYDTYGAHGHVGNYYNWSAAVASNSTSSYSGPTYADIANNPQNSICPAGWRLPTITSASPTYSTANSRNEFARLAHLYANYSGSTSLSSEKLEASPLFLVRAGFVAYGGSLAYASYYANYWSSTVYDSSGAYALYSSSAYVNPADGSHRYYDFSVRCLVR